MGRMETKTESLEERLRAAGWTPCGFLGYWKGPRSGVSISSLNYHPKNAFNRMRAEDGKLARKMAANAQARAAKEVRS